MKTVVPFVTSLAVALFLCGAVNADDHAEMKKEHEAAILSMINGRQNTLSGTCNT